MFIVFFINNICVFSNMFYQKSNSMKKILEVALYLVKVLLPKSRWGNVIYLLLGLAVSNFDVIASLIAQVVQVFK